MTIHDRAASLLRICGTKVRAGALVPVRGAERRRIMADCARRAIAESDDQPDQPRLDYREWRRDWDWSRPIMVGSGRASHWCHATYRWRACIAGLLHEHLGWSGQRVRETASYLVELSGSPARNLAPHALPIGYVDGTLKRQASATALRMAQSLTVSWIDDGLGARAAVERAEWWLWLNVVARPAWGRVELARIVYRLEHDPSYRTPSEAVGLIRSMRGEARDSDLRGASGLEYLDALASQPELWDWMLSRAGAAVRGKLGDVDAVAVPFGLPYPDDFDHVLVMGLNHEIRVRSSDAGDPRATGRILRHDFVGAP